MNSPAFPLTIFYDRSCRLCSEELQAIQDYDRHDRLKLIDCSPPGFHNEAAAAAGVSAFDLMHQIHARDAAGRWYRGVDVFILAYRAADIEAIARMWAYPLLRPLWDRLYLWVAKHRMALSRLHLNAAFGWLVRRAARRAEQRTRTCNDESCRSQPQASEKNHGH